VSKTPRPDQRACIAALQRDVDAGLNRLAIVLPTGTGKGFVLGLAAAQFMLGRRVLILANAEELLDQIHETLTELIPSARLGYVQAERNDVTADIVLAMVQSMSPARCAQIENVGLVMADETHYSVADSWMRVIGHFGCFEPKGTLFIGFTATFVRNDSRGMGDLFQKVSYQKPLEWAIRHGFVLPFDRIDEDLPMLNLRNVDQNEDGDYDAAEVGRMLQDPDAANAVARCFLKYANGHRGIVYAPTKMAARALGEAFTRAGITNAVITGDTKKAERREIYAAAKRGEIQALINVGVLIAGFDDQGIWLIVDVTQTKADSRLTQKAGRAMRVDRSDPTKKRATVVVMRGVEAEIRTTVELKRTGLTRPKGKVPAKKIKQANVRLDGQYKARRDGGYLVVTRLHPDPLEIYRRPMPMKGANEIATKVIRLDQLQRYAAKKR